MEDTLRCVALALHYTILDGHKQSDAELYSQYFDEKTFPLTEAPVPASYVSNIPEDSEIYGFMNRLFHAAALTAECGIITVVYINRIIQYTDLALHASNWKRVLLVRVFYLSMRCWFAVVRFGLPFLSSCAGKASLSCKHPHT